MAPEPDEPEGREDAASPVEARLLGPPMRSWVYRALVFGAPLGLLVAILASFWVASLRVDASVVVVVDTAWTRGRSVAARVQVVGGRLTGIEGAKVGLRVTARNAAEDSDAVANETQESGDLLAELPPTNAEGLTQGTFVVPPALPLGAATLAVRVQTARRTFVESVPVTLLERAEVRSPQPTVSGAIAQWADDTEPQLGPMKLVVRPFGRLVAGFANTLLARVLHPDGKPFVGPVELVLLEGEFGADERRHGEVRTLVRGSTNALGWILVEGPLTSEVLRLELRVLSSDDPSRVVHRRAFRFVSYPGSVEVRVMPRAFRAEDEATIVAHGLGKRSIFVDVYDEMGAFVDTLAPFVGREIPRPFVANAPAPGLLTVQAYAFTHAPGDSAALERVQYLRSEPRDPATLAPLLDKHLEQLSVTRIEKDFDAELERAYLGFLRGARLDAEGVEQARTWLLGTLPVAVFAPPVALITREREVQALAEHRRAWTLGLRIYLLGGGGLFLCVMTWLMVRSHAQEAEKTTRALEALGVEEQRDLQTEVAAARRAALVRGLGVIFVMAAGLGLTTFLLENLLWDL